MGQSFLGLCYEHGRGGLEKDDVEAVRLYQLAAEQSDAMGQTLHGLCYEHDRGGLERDDPDAVRLFRLPAEKEDTPLARCKPGGVQALASVVEERSLLIAPSSIKDVSEFPAPSHHHDCLTP
jgi:TPR repeat protein